MRKQPQQLILLESQNNQPRWQRHLKNSFKDYRALLNYLELDDQAEFADLLTQAQTKFKTLVPLHFAQLMTKGDPKDPLLLQVLPTIDELITDPDFVADPLNELSYAYKQSNIIHKYQNRLLFLPKSNCAVNCRYCFRKNFPYQQVKSNKGQWQEGLDYIKQHPELEEIILSGGDPLMASDQELAYLFQQLQGIDNLKTLRIHSRLPVVIPERITKELLDLCHNSRLQIVICLHINHPNEISPELINLIKLLKEVGVTLLNQTVLLKEVNDDPYVLKQLFSGLFSYGVMPYYLFLLDKVEGTKQFLVEKSQALGIYHQLQAISSGYAVPKLAYEEAQQSSKTLLV